jgi:anti-sigma factor RsiW
MINAFKIKNPCRALRYRLAEAVRSRLFEETDWISRHIAHCPRCCRRLAGFSRVQLAFMLLKSQPHGLGLLREANHRALGMLKHSLREAPKADTLRQAQPEPKWHQRCVRYTRSIGNAAACLAILMLMKAGIFSSMEKFQDEGQKAVQQYYRHHLGKDSPV